MNAYVSCVILYRGIGAVGTGSKQSVCQQRLTLGGGNKCYCSHRTSPNEAYSVYNKMLSYLAGLTEPKTLSHKAQACTLEKGLISNKHPEQTVPLLGTKKPGT